MITFLHEFVSLANPEAVLFINHNQPQLVESDFLLENGVRTDGYLATAARNIR
jgi:hypothetical protein